MKTLTFAAEYYYYYFFFNQRKSCFAAEKIR